MGTNQTNILTESGTNELEVVIFQVGTGTFGINVLKVREIIQPLPLTETPNRHEHVEGIIRLRNEVIPVIDMAKVLDYPPSDNPSQDKFIIGELNQMKVAFHVHGVSRIHRVSWKQIEKPGKFYQGHEANTIGIIKMENEMALLLDFEKIVMDISPESGVQTSQVEERTDSERANKALIIVEDSPVLRKMLEDTLHKAGYVSTTVLQDGNEAWLYLTSLVENNKELPDLVITDLEMPQMDGHHLTLKIKESPQLQHLPVVIFSSLITEDLFHKGVKVGADTQVSKPNIDQLVDEIDKLILP